MKTFRLWVEEYEGNLDIMGKKFQTYNIPPTISIPAGLELPNGSKTTDAVEYATAVDGNWNENERPKGVKLSRVAKNAPFGEKQDTPDEFYLGWNEFQQWWGSILGMIQQGGGAGGML
jgi:hypothetical protein